MIHEDGVDSEGNPCWEWETISEAIEDLPDPHSDHDVDNHVPINHNEETVAKLAEIEHGTNEHPAYARAYPDEPAYTVVCGHMAAPVHYAEPRRLTVRELARLQSFPEEFVFEGTKSDQYATVGESVPPKLGTLIATKLAARIPHGPNPFA